MGQDSHVLPQSGTLNKSPERCASAKSQAFSQQASRVIDSACLLVVGIEGVVVAHDAARLWPVLVIHRHPVSQVAQQGWRLFHIQNVAVLVHTLQSRHWSKDFRFWALSSNQVNHSRHATRSANRNAISAQSVLRKM